MNDCHGLKNPDLPKAIARHEVLCTLEDVIRESAAVLKPGGRLYMVHRPHRLIEIITGLTRYKLEPKKDAICTSLPGQGSQYGVNRSSKGR